MKRILVDMDGVIADVYTKFFDLHEEKYGVRLTIDDVKGRLEALAFADQRTWVNEAGFFRTVPVMPGSVEALRQLNEKYEIIIVSMATEFPLCLTDKRLWLMDHFPFITWRQMVFCGNKSLINGDIMIDDHIKNLDEFRGETIMFNQPHNLPEKTRHRRVDNWEEILGILG